MGEIFSRVFEDLVGRVTGPMSLRLILQPTIATIMAIRDGLQDAKAGRPPYFVSVLRDAEHRRELLLNGWKSIMKVFSVAFILDCVYQWIALRWLYPGEAILMAVLLAIVPYVIVRGSVDRLARTSGRPARGPSQS
jgi:hypothetical protein